MRISICFDTCASTDGGSRLKQRTEAFRDSGVTPSRPSTDIPEWAG